jgi:protein-tyrosine kinase
MSGSQNSSDRLKVARRPVLRGDDSSTEGPIVGTFGARLPGLQRGRVTPVEVDQSRLFAAGLFAPPEAAQRQQQEYRKLRRELIMATGVRRTEDNAAVGPIIVVTSALPGDGKTYSAANIALSIASQGTHDVLLIDGDTIKHGITSAFGLEQEPGLLELLGESPGCHFGEYVKPTSLGRLFILPSGVRKDGAADLFSLGRIEPLFDAIRAELAGQIVVVDSPPILLSSETQALTDVAGQVVFVVRAGVTLHDSVSDALSRIRESVPVGIVLNAWEPALPSDKRAYSAYDSYMTN